MTTDEAGAERADAGAGAAELALVDAVEIELDLDPRVCFAMQQNDVPVVQRLRVTNPAGRAIEDLAVRLMLDGELSGVWEARVARLEAGATWTVDAVDLPLSADVLVRQTERQRARLSAEVFGEGRSLAYRTWPVEVLAVNEWGGLASLPEILAAFVLPNHPAIGRMLAAARAHLERTSGDSSLAGYSRREPARARALVGAVYAALCELELAYVEPPASFEAAGQKVRFPETVLADRMGTCLDLALLAAAALEQLGLHALVVVVEGHAFAGAWTVPESFPEPAVEDALRVKKRAQVGDLVVFETTGVTGRPPMAFERACAEALRELGDAARFHAAIDVHAARRARIRPLPWRLSAEAWRQTRPAEAEDAALDSAEIGAGGSMDSADVGAEARIDSAEIGASEALDSAEAGADAAVDPADVGTDAAVDSAGVGTGVAVDSADVGAEARVRSAETGAQPEVDSAETSAQRDRAVGTSKEPADEDVDLDGTGASTAPPESARERLDRWKRRLLDLSLRNRLIHHRPTKKTLPVCGGELARLEDALAGGRALALGPRPRLMEADDPRDAGAHRRRTGEDAVAAYLADELAEGRLHVDLAADELERRLLELWRTARSEVEESGASTLYLALGFLVWYETPASAEPRRAPILLLPLELERLGPREGYRVRLADDEPRLNVTLLEKLRAEHQIEVAGLDELPTDERGVDVEAVLRAVRRAVLSVDRWEVVDEAAIGLFSFTKFLMWLDLEARKDALLENAVVRHLVERPDAPFPGQTEFPALERLDEEQPPADVLCPLDADSSQLAAVIAARAGASFVLEGPPGTGKSQTIANLVAELLADGKRVLFVSEKMAALEVVHRRLARVGLAPFCLELHSSRAHKREVLAQLGAALEAAGTPEPAERAAAAETLAAERAELNRLVDALHRPRAIGRSVYEVTAGLIGMRAVPAVPLELDALGPLDAARLGAFRAALERVIDAAAPFDLPRAPLAGVGREEWTTSLAGELEDAVRPFAEAAAELDALAERCARELGVRVGRNGERSDLSLATLELLLEIAGLLVATPGPSTALVRDAGWDDLRANLRAWIASLRDRDERRARLRERWEEGFFAQGHAALIARVRAARASWAPLRWWRARGLAAELQAHARGLPAAARGPLERLRRGAVSALEALERDLVEARALRERDAELAAEESEAARLFGAHWRGGAGDPDVLAALVDWTDRFRALLLSAPVAENAELAAGLVALATAERDRVSARAPLGERLRELAERQAAFLRAQDALEETAGATAAAWPGPTAPGWLGGAIARARGWVANARDLRAWCAANRALREARELGLGVLVDRLFAADGSALAPADLPSVLERSVGEAWLHRTIDGEELLRRFTGVEHEARMRRFAEHDRAFLELSARAVAARLAARVPRVGERAAESSEVGILQRQLRLSRRHMPIRRLLARLPSLVPRLKPCFLMSPLSVAQYLDPSLQPFDVVVFDEASQIPVWDAVGAIARGTSVVVVGDSKQLPPTTFFQKLEDEEALAEDDLEELESVLDECVACRLPRARLAWHYRSRHESLIAFSNRHYYDGALQTFPSPVARSERFGVSLHRVDGVYARGGARTNRAEAETVVAEVLRLATENAAGAAPRSVGVVTFSLAQQRLVEDLLDVARLEHPALAALDAGDEPLFVKNLENVQGDERDVILFSVGYGPDEHGRFAMSFGPLNREGGERRLNVAVTRAREQVRVLASFDPADVDLSRTRATGVRHLKAFLEHAARGGETAAEPGTAAAAPALADRPFREAVRARLAERGFEVDERVGTSGYRVDLAVRDPERPDRWRLGVELDGGTYRGAATARDRDRLRAAVLRGLGWELRRVWSTEWWFDPERELARLEAALAPEPEPESERVSEPEPEQVPRDDHDHDSESECADESPSDGDREPEPPAETGTARLLAAAPQHPAGFAAPRPGASSASAEDASAETLPDGAQEPAAADPREESTRSQNAAELDPPGAERYVAWQPGGAPRGDDFHAAETAAEIARVALEVVAREGPVHADVLARRVAACWDLGRVTGRVQERVLDVLDALPPAERPALHGAFYWPRELDPQGWRGFRVPAAADPQPRRHDEIPPRELANAAEALLRQQIALPAADLARELARVFGFQRTTRNVRASMERGIQALAARGGCVLDGERASLPG